MSTAIARPQADHDQVAAVRSLAKVMDAAITIPGTKISIGLDALLGFLPGIGDAISSAIGSYIIVIASHLGVSKAVLARMALNQGIDMLVGIVPFLGDMLDIGWKSNSRNAKLLEQALADPRAAGRQSWAMVGGLILGLIALTVGTVALTWWLMQRFAS
jgi:hypothetical protein